MSWKGKCLGLVILLALFLAPDLSWSDDAVRIGTWKTPQTIQPFFYQEYLPDTMKARILPFTNPADQKTALLAKSLDMCGTTLAHAIYSASVGQPIVIVAALCNRCSALVVKNDGPIRSEKELVGKTIGYVPGTMHEILLRETLTRNGISPAKGVKLMRVDFFDMGTALASGVIDAFLSGEPFPSLRYTRDTDAFFPIPTTTNPSAPSTPACWFGVKASKGPPTKFSNWSWPTPVPPDI